MKIESKIVIHLTEEEHSILIRAQDVLCDLVNMANNANQSEIVHLADEAYSNLEDILNFVEETPL